MAICAVMTCGNSDKTDFPNIASIWAFRGRKSSGLLIRLDFEDDADDQTK